MMKKIAYEYQGCRYIKDYDVVEPTLVSPLDWYGMKTDENGNWINGHFEICWYEGSELCQEDKVRERIAILQKVITKYYGSELGKYQYRNIHVVEE